MVGAKLLHGEVNILPGVLVTDVVADALQLRDAVEDVGDGLGQLVKGDGVKHDTFVLARAILTVPIKKRPTTVKSWAKMRPCVGL